MQKLYQNKEWLKNEYTNKNISAEQISKLFNLTRTAVNYWLRKFNIPFHIETEERLYQNKDWLYQKYVEEKLSLSQIGKKINRDITTIYNWLHKFNIPVRSVAEGTHLIEANHCNLSKQAIEWLNGELLGDGCLYSYSSYSANFIYGSKYLEYIHYISDILKSFGIGGGEIKKKYNKDWDCYVYHYYSHCYVELLPIRKRWYPDGKKIVPRDVTLTPLTCRQFYIGEGCLSHRKKQRPHIVLATYGFLIEDVEWLKIQLNKLGFKATRRSQNRIGISSHSTKQFLDYIGKCPVKCYQYKWEYKK